MIKDGDEALLRVRVYRANDEQALIDFDSMQGPYSIRVPLSELVQVDEALGSVPTQAE